MLICFNVCFMPKKKGVTDPTEKRIGVPLSKTVRDELVDWAAEFEKEIDESVGVTNISAILLTELVGAKNRDIIHKLLAERLARMKEPEYLPDKMDDAIDSSPDIEKKDKAGKRAA